MRFVNLLYLVVGLIGGAFSGVMLVLPLLSNYPIKYIMIIKNHEQELNMWLIFATCFIVCLLLIWCGVRSKPNSE